MCDPVQVFLLDVPFMKLKERVIQRGKKEGGRPEDNEIDLTKRIKVYNEYTKPVVDYYEKMGVVSTFNGNKENNEVAEEIRSKI